VGSKRDTADIDALIGDRIRSRRLQAKVSQEQLGLALGVSFQQVQKYEKGSNRVSAGRLLKIAEVLGCSVMDFLEGLGGGQTAESGPFSKFLATEEGVAIVEAMIKIGDRTLRRKVVDIAAKLAEAVEVRSAESHADDSVDSMA
jgi:transcriptional regulator with XRE-family HTH domain